MIKKQVVFITSFFLVFNGMAMEVDEAVKKKLNRQLTSAAYNNEIIKATELISLGADVNYTEKDDLTALMKAALNGFPKMITLLIQAGAHLEIEDSRHNTALMLATTRLHPSVVQVLIDAGANVNCIASKRLTPLMMAAYFGSHEIATMLLQAKADIYLTSESSGTALSFAAENSQSKLVQMLLHEITLLSPLEKNSIKNWFLVHQRLRVEGRGLPKDLKNLIAETILQLLIKDVHKRLVQAGALQAIASIESHPDVLSKTPEPLSPILATYYCLTRALNEKALKSDLLKQIIH